MIFLYRICLLFFFLYLCRRRRCYCCCKKIAFHMNSKSARSKEKKNLSSALCVHVHDVILNKQQSSESIIKHILCRAFPQCSFRFYFSFSLSPTNSTVWKLERYIKVKYCSTCSRRNDEKMRRKEMQERSLSIYFYLSRFMPCNSTSPSSTFIAFCLKSLTRRWCYRTSLYYAVVRVRFNVMQ